ncbi:MAG: hypothetical protein WDN30_08435 [Pararobbsia sp.]
MKKANEGAPVIGCAERTDMSERGVSAESTVRQAPPRLRVGAAGRPSRGPSRPSRWPATLLAVLLAAPLPLCAWAQTPAGMIVIPGNGEPAGGNAANGTTRSTGAGSAADNGEIVIPGNGEPGARHSAMNIVTVPPGADTQPLHPAGTAGSAASTGSRLSQDNAAIVAASARLREAAMSASASASVQHASAAPRPRTHAIAATGRDRTPAGRAAAAPAGAPDRRRADDAPDAQPSTIPPGANLGAVAPFGMRAAVLNAKVSSASGTAATDARAAAADPHAGAAGAAALAGSQANPANAFNARAQIAGAGQAAQAAAPDGAQPGQTSQQAARGGAQPAQALQQTARDGVQPAQVLQQAARNGAQPDQARRQATRNGAQPVTVTRDAVNTVNVSATPNAAPAGASVPHSVEVVRAAVPAPAPSPVQAPLAGTEDPDLIIQSATDFLRQQVTGLPGKVTVSIPPISPRGLASCANLSAAMAPGAPLWGRTTVAVRCASDKPWTLLYDGARFRVRDLLRRGPHHPARRRDPGRRPRAPRRRPLGHAARDRHRSAAGDRRGRPEPPVRRHAPAQRPDPLADGDRTRPDRAGRRPGATVFRSARTATQ